MYTDVCGNISGQKCHAKGRGKEIKYIVNVQRSTNVEHEMYDYIGNNWSYRNRNTRFKEKLDSHTGKTSVDLLRNNNNNNNNMSSTTL